MFVKIYFFYLEPCENRHTVYGHYGMVHCPPSNVTICMCLESFHKKGIFVLFSLASHHSLLAPVQQAECGVMQNDNSASVRKICKSLY